VVVIETPVVIDLAPADGAGAVVEDFRFLAHLNFYAMAVGLDQRLSACTDGDQATTLIKETP
jgi:hypothetical protein